MKTLIIGLREKKKWFKAPIYDEYTRVKSQLLKYEEGSRGKKVEITNYMMIIILITTSLIVSIYYFSKGENLNRLLIDILTSTIPLIMAVTLIYLQITRLRKDKSEDLYKYEKKALSKRVQELELLKQSSVEEILEGRN